MRAEVVYHLARRDVVKFLRDRQNLVATLVRPLLWVLAVGFGLRRAVGTGATGVDFVSFLVPGVATMAVLFSSMFSAISIVWDREFGFLKELLVAPVPRATLVLAKMISASVTALIEVSVVLLVAPLLGARIDPLGALLAIPVLVAFGMSVSALGITVASRMKTFEGFGGIVNFLIQPVFFFSGALYPLDGLPPALAVVVRLNPMSYAVDATRGLCVGVHHFPIPLDVGIVLATLALLGTLAVRSFSRMQA
ncbi:ABC transporter permease [Polyangium sp. y55x31]|uniref:ABC transporter permease n=1 Tax=Polyangium sp. y55x31 TaxID=3042688 RepID=UPI002482BD41|nr:ABC transporter permease [Polyangium sp. y55x31]MDI1477575.1 ABC transporter permease [Polyangium sp. y55x31]